MAKRLSVPISLVLLASLFGEYVMADDPPVTLRYETQPEGTSLSGDSVPDHMKYQMFVANYQGMFEHSLSQTLSGSDHAILIKHQRHTLVIVLPRTQ